MPIGRTRKATTRSRYRWSSYSSNVGPASRPRVSNGQSPDPAAGGDPGSVPGWLADLSEFRDRLGDGAARFRPT